MKFTGSRNRGMQMLLTIVPLLALGVSTLPAAARNPDGVAPPLPRPEDGEWHAQISAPQVVRPGQPISIVARVASDVATRSDVTWTCWVARSDALSGPKLAVPLFDDGRHGDGPAGDGVVGGSVVLHDAGYHEFEAIATTTEYRWLPPTWAELIPFWPLRAWTACEVVPFQDLAVAEEDIRFSDDRPMGSDSITIFATVRNESEIPAPGVPVTFRALWAGESNGIELGSRRVDLGAGGDATVAIGWRVFDSLDSLRIEVEVSPFVLDEDDFHDNTASRWLFVRKRPQPGEVSGASLDLPRVRHGEREVELTFRLQRPSPTELTIRDFHGRRFRAWRWSSLAAGSHSVRWDGRDSTGTRAPAGPYRCALFVAGDAVRQAFDLTDESPLVER